MSHHSKRAETERVRVRCWQDGVIAQLGESLRRCVEYIHDGTEEGLSVIVTLARRSGADALIQTGITLYYQRLTDDGHPPDALTRRKIEA